MTTKEATERIKTRFDKWALDDEDLDAIRTLIPELADSEDERIRTFLHRTFTAQYLCKDKTGKWHGEPVTNILAYLENQKEQKPTEWSDSVAKEMFIKALERAVEQTKKGYELTDCDKHSWWEDFKAYSEIKSAEWSEEDKDMLNSIVATCQLAAQDSDSGPARHLLEMQERFLNSLRPQPSGNLAISFMKYLDEHRSDGKMCLSNGECADIETAFKKEDWAKIIRYVNKYQTHYLWKPSEEQMNALAWYSGNSGVPPTGDKAIKSLYEQLKLIQ